MRVGKLAVLGFAVLALAVPAQAGIEETATFPGDRLTVRNLIGEVRIESHGGSGFEVVVSVEGRDAASGMITLDREDDRLQIRFPSNVKEFVYPPLGGGRTSFGSGDGGWISELLGRGGGKVRVSGKGSGTELWADVTIRVPRGGELEVEHGVGRVIAKGVDAELELATRNGDIRVDDTRGRLAVATGSGDVQVDRAEGDKIDVATGSGDIRLSDSEGEELNIATGSGEIELSALRGDEVHVGTGSGDVEAAGIDSESVKIGTGSGDISLELDRVGRGDYSVGSGSGDITLSMPAGSSVNLHAETDRGDIEVALADALDYRVQEPDEVRFTVGGGDADVDLGSGSGDITIRN